MGSWCKAVVIYIQIEKFEEGTIFAEKEKTVCCGD